MILFNIKTKKEEAKFCARNILIHMILFNIKTKKEEAIILCQKYFDSYDTYT